MKSVLIACGGTGGHLAPGIALAEELNSQGWATRLLISRKQVDSRLVQKYSNLTYEHIAGCAFTFHPVGLVRFTISFLRGVYRSLRLIQKHRPHMILGFGGFSSAAVLLAGRIAGLPVALHEANRIPGRVCRILGPISTRLFLPKGVSVKIAHASRIHEMALPVRKEIRNYLKQGCKKKMGFNPSQKLLVIVGGSQGAEALNEWVKKNLERFANEEIQVCCVTGLVSQIQGEFVLYSAAGVKVRSLFLSFCDDMSRLLSAADLIVSRSGAGSLAEFVRCRVPAILVPYPFSADGHQEANAQYHEQMGGGMVVKQEYLGDLFSEVKDIIYNDWLLQKFKSNLVSMDRVSTVRDMADDLEEMADEYELEHQGDSPKIFGFIGR